MLPPAMKPLRKLTARDLAHAFILVVLLFGCTGCDEGTADRIKEKATVFRTLTDVQKRAIVDGMFEVGDTSDMVYMAIGSPMSVKSKVIPEGTIEMWTYVNYFKLPSAARLTATTSTNGVDNTANAAQSLAVPENATNTLYVFFLNSRVTQIKLDTQGRK
jgi:hypothetical protein